jgi:hypothetical protein
MSTDATASADTWLASRRKKALEMRHRRVNEKPNQHRRDPSEAQKSAAATRAVSDAIRRQLTTPGSVTPDEQVRLLLADRAAHTGRT